MKRAFVAVVLSSVLAMALAVPTVLSTEEPAAAQYPCLSEIIVNPPEIPAFTETVVNVSGPCCPEGSIASIYIGVDGQELFLGSTPALPGGGFSIDVTVPPLPAADYVITLRCGDEIASTILSVVGGEPTTPGARALPRTGSDPWASLRIAALLVMVGGLLLLFARKRRQQYAS